MLRNKGQTTDVQQHYYSQELILLVTIIRRSMGILCSVPSFVSCMPFPTPPTVWDGGIHPLKDSFKRTMDGRVFYETPSHIGHSEEINTNAESRWDEKKKIPDPTE